MNENRFWSLIELSRPSATREIDDMKRQQLQCDLLRRSLAGLTCDEVVTFQKIFCEMREKANHWDLFRAAMLIEGGCGDDGFLDFRSWLISKGRSVFENAIANPDDLSELAHVGGDQICFFPMLSSVASSLYEELSGLEFPDGAIPEPRDQPEGEEFPFTREGLSSRFPRLWSRFSANIS